MLTYQLCDLAKSPPLSWAHIVGVKLSHLSGYLSALQMHEDAVSVAELRTKLWEAMVVAYPGTPRE